MSALNTEDATPIAIFCAILSPDVVLELPGRGGGGKGEEAAVLDLGGVSDGSGLLPGIREFPLSLISFSRPERIRYTPPELAAVGNTKPSQKS